MAANDAIYEAVKTALVKDGWTITDDPFKIKFEDAELEADLAAERILGAERGKDRIVVEIKSFLGPSPFHDLHEALGQYEIYRMFLKRLQSDRKIFLAISHYTYLKLFKRKSIQAVREESQMKLLVVNIQTEEVMEWVE